MRLEVKGDKAKIKPILEEFARGLEVGFVETKDKWDRRLKTLSNINPFSAGSVEIPDITFTVLDTDEPDKLIFFHSAPTPLLHKVLKLPIRKMEKMLKGYIKDLKGIDCEVHYLGD